MDAAGTLWMVVLSVAVAWLTVVGLILARVPKLPSILGDPDEVGDPFQERPDNG
ncbi:hypothetical protein [Paenarthrobacter sp. NCHU4564]|uniref:hypothetical protein n=1 Tax=Paenarthrobacter sp. NCHU4564 TaxID=3451353 RepID=UPI003F9BB2D3